MALNRPSLSEAHSNESNDLVEGLNNLSIRDSKLIRTITIEPRDQHLTTPRESIGDQSHTNDLIHSIHRAGHTDISVSRPPRPSYGHDTRCILKPEPLSIPLLHDMGRIECFGT